LKIKKVMLKTLSDIYNETSQRLEEFLYKKILPPFFRVLLFGMKLTLAWAFYQTIKNVINDIF